MSATRRDFGELFGRAPDVVGVAPGRVNLIGEHTDYSGGFVLPMAIPQTTRVELAKRSGDVVRVASDDVGSQELVLFELGHERRIGAWIDYVQGTVVALRREGHEVGGFDALVSSDVPVGAGLSSSAALEVALVRALREAFRIGIDDVTVARVGRRAENDFVGAPVGIMDQMAASLADAGAALFVDTRSLSYERITIPASIDVVVIDSGVAHDHAVGNYRTRREECSRAAEALGVSELRDVEDPHRTAALPPPLDRRARHVVTENARVLEAVRCLRRGDVQRLGRLLDESHASLRDDFEVSVPEVDRLVALARADEDVIGARMTGGGFGGAIVALAHAGRGRDAGRRITSAYGPPGRLLVPREVAA